MRKKKKKKKRSNEEKNIEVILNKSFSSNCNLDGYDIYYDNPISISFTIKNLTIGRKYFLNLYIGKTASIDPIDSSLKDPMTLDFLDINDTFYFNSEWDGLISKDRSIEIPADVIFSTNSVCKGQDTSRDSKLFKVYYEFTASKETFDGSFRLKAGQSYWDESFVIYDKIVSITAENNVEYGNKII